jgi:hypothetical protein
MVYCKSSASEIVEVFVVDFNEMLLSTEFAEEKFT